MKKNKKLKYQIEESNNFSQNNCKTTLCHSNFSKPRKYMTATDHILKQILPPPFQALGLTVIPTDLHKDCKITHETCITKHAKLDFTVTIENEDVLDENILHLKACKTYFPVKNDGKQNPMSLFYPRIRWWS